MNNPAPMTGRLPLLRRSAVIFAMRLAGACAAFVLQAAMARAWGAEHLGQYLIIIAAMNLAAVAMPLGFHTIGTYLAAEYAATGAGNTLRAFAKNGYLHILVVTLALFAALSLFDQTGRTLPPAYVVWLIALLLAAISAVTFVSGSVLIGLKRPMSGFLPDALLKPLTLAGGFAVALVIAAPGNRLLVMLVAATVCCLVVAAFQAKIAARAIALLPQQDAIAGAQPETSRWWRLALPWTLLTLATELFFDIDLLILSQLVGIDELAVFGVCTRVFSLLAFGTASIYAVMLPHSVTADIDQRGSEFCRKMADANVLAAAFAALACGATLFAGPILALFGESFRAGAGPLSILCIGLLARSVAGPGALVLSIYDKPFASLGPAAAGFVVLGLANLLLVPRYGITGAASAASGAIIIWSALQWYVTLRRTDLDVSIWPWLRDAVRLRRTSLTG